MSAMRSIFLVWLGLVSLLAVTVGASFLPIGAWRAPVSLFIAAIKAALILWVFMELRQTAGLPRLMLLGSTLFLFVFAAMLVADALFHET